jgi:hypothetical protein
MAAVINPSVIRRPYMRVSACMKRCCVGLSLAIHPFFAALQ